MIGLNLTTRVTTNDNKSQKNPKQPFYRLIGDKRKSREEVSSGRKEETCLQRI